MDFSIRHSKPFQFVFAAVFFLASSGATAIIRQCNMEPASCGNSMSCGNDESSHQPGAGSSNHLIKAEFACDAITLIGGVAIKQALVEQQHKPELPKQIVFCITSSQSLLSAQTNRSSSTFFLTETVSPPAVEKYVLNGSFLI